MSRQGYGNIQTRAFLKGLIKLHNVEGDKLSTACWAQAARLGASERIRAVRQKQAHRFRAAGHPQPRALVWGRLPGITGWTSVPHQIHNPSKQKAKAATAETIYSLCYYDFSRRVVVSQAIALAKNFSSLIVKLHTLLLLWLLQTFKGLTFPI